MAFTWETVVQIIILVLALRALHMVSANNSCSEVRRNFVSKRIGPVKIVPFTAFEAKDLRVCPMSDRLTCCNRQMEIRFMTAARNDVSKVLEYKTLSLRFNFRSFSKNFQGDVVETVLIARNQTKEILRQSLRKKIDSRSLKSSMSALDRLFRSLDIQATPEDVKKAFNRFADKLFLVLLEESNNSTQSDSSYEKCVSKQRSELHPFMDVPTISAANLSSALGLAKVLHQSLAAGAEAANVTESVPMSKSCQRAMLKMQYCSHCYGLTLLKPCMGLCRNVLRGCFAGISELDQYWNYYVNALTDVTERMRSEESKYNLEIALEDFQNKLSSSLSVILENITTLRDTVEEKCKSSRNTKRTKRSLERDHPVLPSPSEALDSEEGEKLYVKFERHEKNKRRRQRGGRKSSSSRFEQRKLEELLRLKGEQLPGDGPMEPERRKVRPPHEVLFNPGQSAKRGTRKAEKDPVVEKRKQTSQMHKRIRGFITSLDLSTNFYRHLPDDMCSSSSRMAIEVSNHGKCWDGTDIVDSYEKDVVPAGYGKQASNPEVKVTKVEKGVIKAIDSLRQTAMNLLSASGKTEVPGLLLHSPLYERREEDVALEFENEDYPCDDEDDCTEYGSGDFDLDVTDKESTSETDIEILIDDDITESETSVTSQPNSDDVAFEEDDKKPKDKKKNGRKINKDHHRKKNNRDDKSQETTTPGGSALSNKVVSHIVFWFLCVLSSLLNFVQN
ncbi:glypican-5-like [Styela clava]